MKSVQSISRNLKICSLIRCASSRWTDRGHKAIILDTTNMHTKQNICLKIYHSLRSPTANLAPTGATSRYQVCLTRTRYLQLRNARTIYSFETHELNTDQPNSSTAACLGDRLFAYWPLGCSEYEKEAVWTDRATSLLPKPGFKAISPAYVRTINIIKEGKDVKRYCRRHRI